MKNEKKITISDIARLSGYSKTAVSFAFNSPERIGAEAREHILQVAKEYDFIPNPLARSLSLGKHKAIGFLLPQDINQSLANPYIQDVIRGIGLVAQENGYMLTIIPPLRNSIPEAVKNATVDGIITMGIFVNPEINDVLRQRHMPVVSIDGDAQSSLPSVSINDKEAGYIQMRAVLKNGHTRIAVVTLPCDAYYESKMEGEYHSTLQNRIIGYKKALEEYNLDWNTCVTEYRSGVSYDQGIRTADSLLDQNVIPSVIVTMSDIVAIGIMQRFKENKFVIGKDISVVGFDGISEGIFTDPPLATISQPGSRKGQLAAGLLFRTLNHEDVNTGIVMPCLFLDRPSLGNINEH